VGLLEHIQGFLHSAKDAGASFVIERFVAHRIERYGRMINLAIDSKNSKIRIEVLPKGETEPIAITIDEYQLVTHNNGAPTLVIKKIGASREWMDALLKDFATDKSIALPEKYASVIKTVL
jgi:hypothetical protein